MKLCITPRRSGRVANYSRDGSTLVVTVDGVTDTFDFANAAHGEYTDFISNALPSVPIRSAIVDATGITVEVIGYYGPRPERDMERIPVTDENGEIINYEPEPNAEYAERLAAWDALREEREIEL